MEEYTALDSDTPPSLCDSLGAWAYRARARALKQLKDILVHR